jgi:hypothetical protein
MPPSRPSTPPQFGPRYQSVHDTIFPTPSLANFLNNNIERIPIHRLSYIHQTCIVCSAPLCDRPHYLPYPLSKKVPPPAPTQAHKEALKEQQRRSRRSPRQPAPEPTVYLCPNQGRCELAVRVTTKNCFHVFGTHCLVEWIRKRRIRCPICNTLWFKMEEKVAYRTMLIENWPHVLKTAEGEGIVENGVQDTEVVNGWRRFI